MVDQDGAFSACHLMLRGILPLPPMVQNLGLRGPVQLVFSLGFVLVQAYKSI